MLMAMDSHPSPTISSFVIRFVVDGEAKPNADLDAARPTYRGAIHHIQSDKKMNFSNWEEVVAFIRRFVPLEAENGREEY